MGAANIKLQLIPIVFLILLFTTYQFIVNTISKVGKEKFYRKLPTISVAILLASLLIFATPIKNIALHGNPAYPIKLEVAGFVLNNQGANLPRYWPNYLNSAPQFQRWIYSILEINAFDVSRPVPWVADQYAAYRSPADRMGGYLWIYVIFNLILLVYIHYRYRSHETWAAVVLIVLISAITSIMPQSHELRYYMYWIISLISLNLYLVPRIKSPIGRRVVNSTFKIVALVALLTVIFLTQGMYIFPQFYTLSKHIEAIKINQNTLIKIKESEKVCIVGKQPNTFFYAHKFHSKLNYYAVKAALSKEECGLLKVINN